MSIEDKLRAVREWMAQEGLDALVVPTDDPHGSEYLAEHWQCRKWLTGFTGSAGTAVVTMDDALLWTDSRYWLQAEEQLEGTGIRLMSRTGWLPIVLMFVGVTMLRLISCGRIVRHCRKPRHG